MQKRRESPPCPIHGPNVNKPHKEPLLLASKILRGVALSKPSRPRVRQEARGLQASPEVRLRCQKALADCWAVPPTAPDALALLSSPPSLIRIPASHKRLRVFLSVGVWPVPGLPPSFRDRVPLVRQARGKHAWLRGRQKNTVHKRRDVFGVNDRKPHQRSAP